MGIIDTSCVGIAIKSYDRRETSDAHDFVQLVLPVSGEMHIAIEATRKRLNPLRAAIVPAAACHAQYGIGDNRSLILDVDMSMFAHRSWDRLIDMRFTEIGAAARKLIEFMQVSIETGAASPIQLQAWITLLFDTMTLGAPQAQSRLAALLAQIDSNPALPWTTDSMAKYACMSASRLHTLFQQELNVSPRVWLLQKRLALACELLARTNRTITDVALSTGFTDQSALTRAMRHKLDITPAVYRRCQQETRHQSQ